MPGGSGCCTWPRSGLIPFINAWIHRPIVADDLPSILLSNAAADGGLRCLRFRLNRSGYWLDVAPMTGCPSLCEFRTE